jgi:hypothetical protein
MAMFKAFKPSGMEKIARAMGYQGNMQGFQDYLAQDPMRQQQMQGYQQKAMQMAKGGVVKMQTGGAVRSSPGFVTGPQGNLQQQGQLGAHNVTSGEYRGIPFDPNAMRYQPGFNDPNTGTLSPAMPNFRDSFDTCNA